MSFFVPKDQRAAYQRWSFSTLDAAGNELNEPTTANAAPMPKAAEAETASSATKLPTAEAIERLYLDTQASAHATGYQEGQTQAQNEAAKITQLLTGIELALHKIEQDVAEQLLNLAIEIAKQMVGQSLRVKPELLLPIVRDAIATLAPQQDHPTLFVPPQDVALVEQHLGEQLAHKRWRIIADASLEAGGCRAEVGHSEVDASTSTRWRRVIEAIGVNDEWLDT
ncbi:MAG: flagellar assembly protein FliH [Pseudomonadota bacterium]